MSAISQFVLVALWVSFSNLPPKDAMVAIVLNTMMTLIMKVKQQVILFEGICKRKKLGVVTKRLFPTDVSCGAILKFYHPTLSFLDEKSNKFRGDPGKPLTS